jgi:electron transfer flavoprotein beta subunit
MLNVIVCIKSVPGNFASVVVGKEGKSLEPVVRSYCINETDEYAIDEALALRSKHGGQVTVLSAGTMLAEEKLQTAVAKGADRAIRLDLPSNDPQIISLALSEAIRKLKFDLILTGLESSDNMAAQVGTALAENLGIPFLFAATGIEISAGSNFARVTKELGNASYQVVEVNLPALISTQTGIQKLTYAPVAKLLQARRRGIDCLKSAELPLTQAALKNTSSWRFMEVFQIRKKHTVTQVSGTPREIAAELKTKIKTAL